MVEFVQKLDEKMKVCQEKQRKMYREPIVMGRKLGLKSTVWTRRKKETSNQKRMKKQEFKKMRRSLLRNLQDILKHSNIRIIGLPEGEEEEQKIENLFEQIMKENFPSLAKEIDVQEAQRVPKKLNPRRNTPRHIIITLPKIKEKERILETAREKDTVTYKGVPRRLSADFSKETLQARRGWKEVFQVMKGKDLHPRFLYPAKLSFRMEG